LVESEDRSFLIEGRGVSYDNYGPPISTARITIEWKEEE
jgi:hypothetical protein